MIQVTATDGDKDREHNIVYFLTGQGIDPDQPDQSKFDINRTTGEIYVLKPLDRDEPGGRPQWRFTVFAQDDGELGFHSSKPFLVYGWISNIQTGRKGQ